MPGGDRTGPHGDGPMTGRRFGNCVGNYGPGFNFSPGNFDRGFGSGRGAGRGMRYRFDQGWSHFSSEMPTHVSEETLLENEVKILKEHLASLEKQLSDIKKEV